MQDYETQAYNLSVSFIFFSAAAQKSLETQKTTLRFHLTYHVKYETLVITKLVIVYIPLIWILPSNFFSVRCLFIQLEGMFYAAKIISHDLTKAQTFCWTKCMEKFVSGVCDVRKKRETVILEWNNSNIMHMYDLAAVFSSC